MGSFNPDESTNLADAVSAMMAMCRFAYLEAIKNGFTKEESMELCKTMLLHLMGNNGGGNKE